MKRLFGKYRAVLLHEEGSSLVLALIFTTMIFLVIAALLSFASTSFDSTITLTKLQGAFSAVDGSVEGAINSIRGISTKGTIYDTSVCPLPPQDDPGTAADESDTPGVQIFSSETSIEPSGEVVTADVKCKAAPDSGLITGEVQRGRNAPLYAIIARSTVSPAIKQNSNNTIRVGGDVYANASVTGNTKSKFVVVDSQLTVNGTCTAGYSQTTGSRVCSAGMTPPTFPTYAPPAIPDPPLAPPDEHCANNDNPKYVRFYPGKYTDVSVLTGPASRCGNDAVYWLQPKSLVAGSDVFSGQGVFYFEFDDTWRIAGGQYVGGDLPLGISAAKSSPLGTKCRLDTSGSDTNHGVELVFGKKSNLQMTGGVLELCPEFSADSQQISIFGLTTGVSPQTVPQVLADTAASLSTPPFLNPDKAKAPQSPEDPATATVRDGQTASLKMTFGAALGLAIPDGSSINRVTLHFKHKETGDTAKITNGFGWTFTPSPGNGSALANQKLSTSKNTYTDDKPVLSTLYKTAFNQDLTRSALIGSTVDYFLPVVGNNASVSAFVDAIYMEITYTPPGFASSTCSAGTGCKLIDTSGNPNGGLLTHGTVYAPLADITVQITEDNEHILSRGVDVNSLEINKTGAARSVAPVISLPTDTSGTQPRVVLFTALVDDVPRLRARVAFTDFTAGGLPQPGRRAAILNWSVIRAGAA